MEKLKNAAHQLDDVSVRLHTKYTTINDVETSLSYLLDDTEAVKDRASIVIHHHEVVRQLRLLRRLLNYAVNEMSEEIEELSKLNQTIFGEVIQKNKP